MKKICALLIACLLLSTGMAFAGAAAGVLTAGQIIKADNGKTSTDPEYYELASFAKLSTGVSLGFKTGVGTYAIITKHTNGDKQFGAAANDGKNYVLDALVGASASAPTASDSSFFVDNAWSTL